VILETLMAWGINQGDNLIVGKFLTTEELGLYRTGFDLDGRIFVLFLAPIIPVLYSKFCTLGTNEDKINYYKKIKKYISMLVFPVIVGLVLVSGYFDNLILGDKWKGIGFVMALLSLNPGISNLWNLLPAFLKSLGKPQIATILTVISFAIFLPVYLIFVKYGLKTFVISRASIGIVGIITYTYIENKELKINLSHTFRFYFNPFIASIVMFAFGFCLQKYVFSNNYTWLSLIIVITLSAAVYIIIIFKISKNEILELKSIILKKIGPTNI
ncbi:MAG: oligosaccharide flippase family protein, partial [Candidatus Helarchaeota archaeon]